MQSTDRKGPAPRSAAGVAALLTALLAGADMAALSTTLPAIVNDLTSGIETYAWPFFLYMAAFIASMPLWGMVTGRLGRKWTALIGVLVYIGGSVLATGIWQFVMLVGCRILQGAGLGAVMPAVYSLALDSDGHLPRFVPWMTIVGGLAGGPLAWWLLQTQGWPRLFWVQALAMLAVGLGVLLTPAGLRDRRALARHVVSQLDRATWPVFSQVALPATLMLSGLLGFNPDLAEGEENPVALPTERGFRAAAAMSTLMGMAIVTTMVFLPVHLQGSAGLPLWTTAAAMALIGLGLPAGTALAGRLTGGLGKTAVTRLGLGLATVAALGTATLRPITPTAFGWLATVSVFGFGMGLAHGGLLAFVRENLPPGKRGPGLGLLMAFRSIGGPFGTGLVGSELAAVLAFTLMPLEKTNRFMGPQHGADLLPRIANDLLPLLRTGTAVCLWTIAVLTAIAALVSLGWNPDEPAAADS